MICITILLIFLLLLKRFWACIAILGVGIGFFRGEGGLVLTAALLGSAALIPWRPCPLPSDGFVKKRLCSLLRGGEKAILVDNVELVKRRHRLRWDGPDEELVEPL